MITIPRALLEQALEALTCNLHPTWIGLPQTVEAIRAELAKPKRCDLCGYQHGHQIGCANNPVDIALSRQALRAEPAKPVEPATPAWHDAPEVAALKAERDELLAALQGVAQMSRCGQLDQFIGEPWLNSVFAAIAKARET